MIRIVADSTCDLSKDLLVKYGIEILPLYIVLGDKEYPDGAGLSAEDIYQWSDANNATPKTAACSFDLAKTTFQKCLDDGMEVISFSISHSMSTTGNVMRMAAAETSAPEKIHIIDSANLSTGIGLLVIEAAIMAQAGHSAQEIVAHVEALKTRVHSSFVVDTLTYLHRGGRCSGAAALIGGTLKLHPMIVVKEGKMQPDKKYRGKITSVIRHYMEDLQQDLLSAQPNRVFITHSGCADEDVEMVREYLAGLNYFSEILVTRTGGVISSHCGPGTLGILFIGA